MKLSFFFATFFISLFIVGCAGQTLPPYIIEDIEETYENIQSYSAVIENRLEGDRFDVDQEWQLSVQKPDKYKRVLTKVNDEALEPPAVEICNGARLYNSDVGITEPYNCEKFVGQTFDVIEKLNSFSSDLYDSTLTLDNNNFKVKIIHVESGGETNIFVDKESYLIKNVMYRTSQSDGSVSIRNEVYKNIILNQNFDSDEFEIPSDN